jgi:uroporphyrinogen-III synthase
MNDNTVHILSTRPLPAEIINDALQKGIVIDVISFIETSPILTIEVQQEIEQALLQRILVVFTSMNAVEAVANEMIEMRPDWEIYCIGSQTSKLVAEYFGEESIKGKAQSAEELAELIIDNEDPNEIYFFCGSKRRDILPNMLRENEFNVWEVEVYQTNDLPVTINKNYAGILFYSPSAVKSYFKNNKAPEHSLLFAIGETTAAEIKIFSNNQVIIAEEPGKENLATLALEFFYAAD